MSAPRETTARAPAQRVLPPGQAVLVTGASRGIGRAIAERLASSSRGVVVNYRSGRDNGRAVAEGIKKRGGQALECQADVGDPEAVERMATQIRESWGRLDAIIHNASAPMRRVRFEETDWNEFERHWATQVRGAFNLVRAFLPELRAASGHVIFILSSSVLQQPPAQVSAYVTGKYALLGFARSVGVELAKSGIRVNMVSPYVTPTDMQAELPPRMLQVMAETHPLRRLATVQDTAAVVEFLLAPEAGYLHLANIPVTGGMVA